MHGLSVLCRCKPFHKILENGKTLCELGSIPKSHIDINNIGWEELPEDRCKRCLNTNKKSLKQNYEHNATM